MQARPIPWFAQYARAVAVCARRRGRRARARDIANLTYPARACVLAGQT